MVLFIALVLTMIELNSPYLLFLGAETDPFAVKTARGVAYWCKKKMCW